MAEALSYITLCVSIHHPKRYGMLSKRTRRTAFSLLLGATLLATPAFAQDICSYTWNSDSACSVFFPCVSADDWDGLTITVPSNVTRISRGGLKVCLADSAVFTSADIVYIVDFSGSMAQCYRNPGDPYYQRADAIRAGYEYQRDSVPGSTFGYLGFTTYLVETSRYSGQYDYCEGGGEDYLAGDHILELVDPSVAANQTSIEDMIAIVEHDQLLDGVSGTNYYRPLREALHWFQDGDLSPNPNKAIVFITDGNPTSGISDHREIVDSLELMGVPIYGIYMGSSVGSYLTEIVDETGGYTTLVEPTSVGLLAEVVRDIVRDVNTYAFDTLSVYANGVTSQGVTAVKNPDDGTWELTLDSIIPLQPGLNTVEFYAEFAGDSSSTDRTIDFSFTIDASGSADPACYDCRSASELALLTTTGADLDSLDGNSTAYRVRVTYYGGDDLDFVDVLLHTDKGDSEYVRISSPSVGGSGELIFETQVPFSIVDVGTPATAGNGNTEALPNDTVRAFWSHPTDSQDVASDLAPVLAPPDGVEIYDAAGDPSSLTPYDAPTTTIDVLAGDALPLHAKMFRGSGWLSVYETDPTKAGLFAWQVRNAATGAPITPAMGALSATSGPGVAFTPYQSRNTLNIIVTFTEDATLLRDTVRVRVLPSLNRHLSIEANADSLASPSPLTQITLSAGDLTRVAYGIIRDEFDNFAGYASSATWDTRDNGVCTVALTQAATGEATVTRVATGDDQAYVVADQDGSLDSVLVITESITYNGLRIVVNAGGTQDIDTLVQRTDQDTTLLALGQRSDNGQWVLLPVSWTAGGLNTTPGVPGTQVDSWTFRPTTTGSGWIRAVWGTRRDSVWADFQNGLPSSLALYEDEGDPVLSTEYARPPVVDTLVAGQSVQIVAKVFDDLGAWLSVYDNSSAPVSWSLNELSGNPPTGALSSSTGHLTSFTPTRAYNTVEVVATFDEGGIVVNATVRFYVVPAAASHLVIEASPLRSASPNADAPLPSVTVPGTDTAAYAYAILRDAYGNYISPATTTTWASSATGIVVARMGVAANGEGEFARRADQGSATVTATSGGFSDDIIVNLSNISYDSLRIVNGGLVDVENLVLRTDQSTTLYALGQRSDNGEWDNLPVMWSSVGVTTIPGAPGTEIDQWAFAPGEIGNGRVVIRLSSDPTTRDSAFVSFTHGLPDHVELFPGEGAPYVGANQPLPDRSVTDTIPAASVEQYVLKVFDHRDVWLDEYEIASAPISWRLRPAAAGVTVTDSLVPAAGHLTTFRPYDARKEMYIIGEFSALGFLFRDTVRVYVSAAGPDHMVIEGSADPNAHPNDDAPVYAVTLTSRDTITSVYAIIRDEFGNWVDYSRETNWGSLDTSVVEARGNFPDIGQGDIIRVASTAASTRVYAVNVGNPSLTDTISVEVNDVTYDSLRIVAYDGDEYDIDTLRIRTDQDTTLFALGLRSDNGVWDNVFLRWQAPGLTTNPVAPANSDQWTFGPVDTNDGYIRISYVDSAGTTIYDRVEVVFDPGLPNYVDIYNAAGQPGVNNVLPYADRPVVDTISADSVLTLVGKIFDHQDVWLSEFETPLANIAWRIVELQGTSPTGTLSQPTGYLTEFSPSRAFNRVYVVSSYQAGGTADTVQFYIESGVATHLVLEAGYDPTVSPNDDNPATTIPVGTRDTVANVYAILRDAEGNFVGYADNLVWTSLDTSVVTAGPGNSNFGEGRIIRNSDESGQTFVVAHIAGDPSFRDTVAVTLSNVSYDSLRIVDVNQDPITSTVTTDTDADAITVYVQGLRSDNGRWENVAARWSITPGLSTTPAPPTASSAWNFTANDTGRGDIWVSLEDAVGDTIDVFFDHGAAAELVLYGETGAPSATNPPLPPAQTSIEIDAGQELDIVAKLFDNNGVWLSEYESGSSPVTWTAVDSNGAPLGGVLDDTSGYTTTFSTTLAPQVVLVVAEFSEGGLVFLDSVLVRVTHAPASQLVLESDADWRTSPYDANPLDTLTLTQLDTLAHVYAIIRDEFGNFVSYSTRTSWGNTGDDSVVVVTDNNSNIGDGLIEKVYAGSLDSVVTRIYAVNEDDPTLTDTLDVTVLRIYYKALRIMEEDTVNGGLVEIDSLTLGTDDSLTLFVQGQRSDNDTWVTVSSAWETSAGLGVSPVAPALAHSWRFSPTAPDTSWTAWIRVTRGTDEESVPDTLPVYFFRSPPSRVDFRIIDPANALIAGDTIHAVIRISNNDGPVPGIYCLTGNDGTFYWNPLTIDSDRPDDIVLVDGTAVRINPEGDTTWLADQCFENGIDTVALVLYYAPFDDDSLSRLYVDIGGVVGSTLPFRLLPGELAAMQLEDKTDTPYGDSLTMLYPNAFALFVAMGYDIYGNRRGAEESDWKTTGPIPPATVESNEQMFYMITTAEDNHRGYVVAQAQDTSSGVLIDSVYIIITGHLAEWRGATAYDTDGNGLLDRIVAHFSKPLRFPGQFDPSSEVEVEYGSYAFDVDTGWTYGADSTELVIALRQDALSAQDALVVANYQTAWEPLVTSDFGGAAFGIEDSMCTDGAGPVIVSVYKDLTSAFDRAQDVVTVTFSEPVRGGMVGDLGIQALPDSLFDVWLEVGDELVLQPDMLDSITGLGNDPSGTNQLVFVMENGLDLMTHHFLSIRVYGCDSVPSDCGIAMLDSYTPPNAPHPLNRRVRVILQREPPDQAVMGPNPATPTTSYVNAGEFNLEHTPEARSWVQEGGGVMVSFPVTQPTYGVTLPVKAYMKIYDLSGNMVQEAVNSNIVEGSSDDVSVYNVDVYWNGYNQKGTPVAPGVYRFIIYLDYADSQQFDTKLYGNIGITR